MKRSLFTNKTCHIGKAVINETRDQSLVASKQFCISLFNKRNPKFFHIRASTKHIGTISFVDWNPIIDNYIPPFKFFEKSQAEYALISETVENGWKDSHRKKLRYLAINKLFHLWTNVVCSTSDQLVTGC